MLTFLELQKRTYGFYEKNTYLEIQNGDIGVKVYPIETVIISDSSTSGDYTVYEYSKTDIISKIETKSELKGVPALAKSLSGVFISGSSIQSGSELGIAVLVTADIINTSRIELRPSVFITTDGEFKSRALIEIETLTNAFFEKGGNYKVLLEFISSYNTETIIPKRENLLNTTLITEEYFLGAIFPPYKRDYKAFNTLSSKTYDSLKTAMYADLEFSIMFCYERSVEI